MTGCGAGGAAAGVTGVTGIPVTDPSGSPATLGGSVMAGGGGPATSKYFSEMRSLLHYHHAMNGDILFTIERVNIAPKSIILWLI